MCSDWIYLKGKTDLKLDFFQQEVRRLTDSWSDTKIESVMFLLTEEMGELVHAIRKSRGTRWGHESEEVISPNAITEEFGDVLFLLARVSLILGIDLNVAASDVLKKIEQRMAQSPKTEKLENQKKQD